MTVLLILSIPFALCLFLALGHTIGRKWFDE